MKTKPENIIFEVNKTGPRASGHDTKRLAATDNEEDTFVHWSTRCRVFLYQTNRLCRLSARTFTSIALTVVIRRRKPT